jgi:hypothetical protein
MARHFGQTASFEQTKSMTYLTRVRSNCRRWVTQFGEKAGLSADKIESLFKGEGFYRLVMAAVTPWPKRPAQTASAVVPGAQHPGPQPLPPEPFGGNAMADARHSQSSAGRPDRDRAGLWQENEAAFLQASAQAGAAPAFQD